MMKITKTAVIFGIACCLSIMVSAQLPITNVHTLDLRANEQKVLLNNLKYLSEFNNSGYNNQPYFINENELLITSDYESSGLTDILLLDLSNHQITRITKTEESEYSPTMMSNGIDFSVVRQEVGDNIQIPQVLWSYPLDRSDFGRQVVDGISNIGYHIWVTKDKLALYLVGTPSELVLYDVRNKTTTHISSNVGRCLKVDKKNNLYFIQNEENGSIIRSYDTYLGRSQKIGDAIKDQEDFEILPNGHLIAADGSKLLTLIPLTSGAWIPNIDLNAAGIQNISRIASSKNKIAIVSGL